MRRNGQQSEAGPAALTVQLLMNASPIWVPMAHGKSIFDLRTKNGWTIPSTRS